jgi:hypothetical protein
LSSDVVRLICQHGWDIGIGADRGKKNAEISDPVVVGEAKERKANEAEDSVEDDDWATEVQFVGIVGLSIHDYSGCYVRWSNEALCFC